ncbi:MAG: hypothetical protein WCO19_03720 [Candidatus Saccharibacteria bacterium]
MVNGKQTPTSKPTEFYKHQQNQAAKLKAPITAGLDSRYVRKIGVKTLLLSLLIVPFIGIAWIITSSLLFAIAHGHWEPLCGLGAGDYCYISADKWYLPVFIVITTLFIGVGWLAVKKIYSRVKKRYPPQYSFK